MLRQQQEEQKIQDSVQRGAQGKGLSYSLAPSELADQDAEQPHSFWEYVDIAAVS